MASVSPPPCSPVAEPPRGSVQVVARAAAVLRALKDHPGGLSLGQLARLLALPRSTVQRIVDALDVENLVMAAAPQRGVRLGPALLALAAATRFEPARVLRPLLEFLSRESGETVNLAVLDGHKLVYIDQVVGGHQLRTQAAVGVSTPMHSTATGKAMLAAMSEQALAAMRVRIPLTRFTPSTLTSWAALEQELAAVRRTHLALDREENAPGICGMATALRLRSGELAAVSLPIPSQRFGERLPELQKLLLGQRQRWQRLLSISKDT